MCILVLYELSNVCENLRVKIIVSPSRKCEKSAIL